MEALKHYIKELCDIYGEKYPYIDIVREFAKMDSFPATSFFNLENRKAFLVGAAIWILDELHETGGLREAGLYMSHDPEDYYRVRLPDMRVPLVPKDLLKSMIYTIWERNDEAEDPEHGPGGIMTEAAAARYEPITYARPDLTAETEEQAIEENITLSNRKRFDAILSLLPKDSIDRAVEKYKKAVYDFCELYLRCADTWYKACRDSADRIKKHGQFLVESERDLNRQPSNPLLMTPGKWNAKRIDKLQEGVRKFPVMAKPGTDRWFRDNTGIRSGGSSKGSGRLPGISDRNLQAEIHPERKNRQTKAAGTRQFFTDCLQKYGGRYSAPSFFGTG